MRNRIFFYLKKPKNSKFWYIKTKIKLLEIEKNVISCSLSYMTNYDGSFEFQKQYKYIQ